MEKKAYFYTDQFQERLILRRIFLKKEESDKEALLVLADIRNRKRKEAEKKQAVPFGTLSFSVENAFDGYFFSVLYTQRNVTVLFSNPFKSGRKTLLGRIKKERKVSEKRLALSKEHLLSLYGNKASDPLFTLSSLLPLPGTKALPTLNLRGEVTLRQVRERHRLVSASLTGEDIYLGEKRKKDPLSFLPAFSSATKPTSFPFPSDRELRIPSGRNDLLALVRETKPVESEIRRKQREACASRYTSSLEKKLSSLFGTRIERDRKLLTPFASLLLFSCPAKKRTRFREKILAAVSDGKAMDSSLFLPAYSSLETRQVLFNEESLFLLSRIAENALYGIKDSLEDYLSPLKREKEDVLPLLSGRKPIRVYSLLSKED